MKRIKEIASFIFEEPFLLIFFVMACICLMATFQCSLQVEEYRAIGLICEITRGENGASVKIYHTRRSMNNAVIEVYDDNKIKVSLGDDTKIIPVSENPITIDRVEPIHKVVRDGGFLFFGNTRSVESDHVSAYIVKVRYGD